MEDSIRDREIQCKGSFSNIPIRLGLAKAQIYELNSALMAELHLLLSRVYMPFQ